MPFAEARAPSDETRRIVQDGTACDTIARCELAVFLAGTESEAEARRIRIGCDSKAARQEGQTPARQEGPASDRR